MPPPTFFTSSTRSSRFGPNTATCPARAGRPEPIITRQERTSPARSPRASRESASVAGETIRISTAPGESLQVPRRRAGKTFVSFTTRRSFAVTYSGKSAIRRCSTTPVSRWSTIMRSSPRFSEGCCAMRRVGRGYQNCLVFIPYSPSPVEKSALSAE